MSRSPRTWLLVLLALPVAAGSCGDDEVAPPGTAGSGGTGAATTTGGTAGAGATGANGGTGGVPPSGHDCTDPAAAWLLCEDFEAGAGDFDTWFAGSDFQTGHGTDDRGRMLLVADEVHGGNHALHMPAAASSGYQGGSLDWRKCIGPQEAPCELDGFDQLYFRAWVRFAPDHRYVHHFLSIGGSQPDQFWSLGAAGCLPSGEQKMGTTVDFHEDSHETFFYTYYPEMSCNPNCHSYMGDQAVQELCAHCEDIGMPTCDVQEQCCWGDEFEPDPAVALPVGEWFCLEMMLQGNTPNQHDGVMAYWIDGALGHQVDGMMWRTIDELALNRVGLQHYIETEDAGGHSNQAWFDDVVVSTQRIGCD